VEGVAEWRKVIPPAIREQVSYQGKTYGVPVNVYRVNTVFYNKKVFERFGLTEPTSPADLPLMAEKLRGSGISLLAVGSREPWTLALLTFECLLVAREGPAFYSDYFHGRLAPDDLRMARTLSAALELSRYFNRDHDELAWTDAVDLVADGRAAMTVMGGWARSAFYGRGLKPGVDFGEIPFPGSANTFVFTSDTFSLPAAARNRPGARRLLTTMGLRETQRMINEDRGALSPRLDVPIPDDEPISLANHALLTRGALVLALSGIAPGLFVSDVTDSVPEMLAEHDIEPVMETLRSRHVLLH
jgi:glucose/mannose transport system substrate-binding protein